MTNHTPRFCTRQRLLVGSVSGIALLFAAQSALAQDVTLDPDDEIIVTGIRQQLLEAAQFEREADTIISVITADDIGQFPDQNIAETLQRVPGLTIIRDEGEGRYVQVRGLDKSFVQVTVNNATIGTSDSDSDRSVALDVIPSDLLSKVEVGKTLLPDQDHASLGAKIDLRPLSAFDRSDETTATVRLQGTYSEDAGEVRPKVTADFTARRDTKNGAIGIAGALNYFERAVQLDRLQSDSSGGIESINGILAPRELDQRFETGERKRLGATLSLDWEVNEDHKYNFSALYGELDDDDIRVQQEVELRDASGTERIVTEPGTGLYSDVDLERQIFFQPRVEETIALHFEGSNTFAEDWTLSYAVDYSENSFVLKDGVRGRFRERDSVIGVTWGEDFGEFLYLGNGDFNSGGPEDFDFRPTPENFNFDGLLIIDENRQDDILSYNADLEHRFSTGARDYRIKVGAKFSDRQRSVLRGEDEVDIDDFIEDNPGSGLPANLGGIANFFPDSGLGFNGGIEGLGFFADLDAYRNTLASAINQTGLAAINRRQDFTVDEEIAAFYAMGEVNFSDDFQVIAGIRVEDTTYDTTGTTERRASLDLDLPSGDNPPVTLDNPSGELTFSKSYTEVMPSIHMRWDATDNIVTRLSYAQGQVRPGFGAARALQTVSFEFIVPDGVCPSTTVNLNGTPTAVCVEEAERGGGNPLLDPLTADQFDFNLGWYPSDSTVVTFAAFYKDLKDLFVSTNSSGGEDFFTGITFTETSGIINGEGGELLGAEISATHFFDHWDGFFGNLFVSGNLTLIDGSFSDPDLRGGEEFSLPGQSDIIGNVSIGYEDDDFLIRGSLNHRGSQLASINSSTSRLGDEDLSVRDVYQGDFTSLDITARWNVTDMFQIFGEVSNLNNATELDYYQGDENGRIFERFEDYGRTFTFGVVSSF